jgi:predicted Zn-dependent protease
MLLLTSFSCIADVGGIDVDATLRKMHESDLHYSEYQQQQREADNRLPQIGIPGSSVITVQEERVFGKYYFRKARENLKVISDPVLDDYIKDLGARLIAHANNVHFPFNFFLTEDKTINASAFLGGNVRIHTGLVSFTENESQLASVLAHEITHVTQRHVARFIEDAAARQNLTIGAVIGGIILAVINPALGMATLQTTLGLNMQAQINYTRNDEFEADHIGIDLMYRAGFDPIQMAVMFGKMTSLSYRNIPQGLLTHPIPEVRVSEARSRAEKLPARKKRENPNYCFAKARIKARFSNMTGSQVIDYFQKSLEDKKNTCSKDSLLYGLTLGYLANNDRSKAKETLGRISSAHSSNNFILDTRTDLYIAGGTPESAVAMLKPRYDLTPNNQTVVLNYAVALNAAGKTGTAIKILKKFISKNPENIIAYDLLAKNYRKENRMYEYNVAMAEFHALCGNYTLSNSNILQASRHARTKLEKARLDAMMVRNEQTRISDKQFEKK